MKLIILSKHNGEYQNWNEIEETELNTWMIDGSLQDGDKVVYPNKVLEVKVKKQLELIDTSSTKENKWTSDEQFDVVKSTNKGSGEWYHEDYDSSTKRVMKTKCGKRVHLIGVGICGQEVYQVQENDAPEQDHNGWRLCRLENGKLISFGKSGIVYTLDLKLNKSVNHSQELKAPTIPKSISSPNQTANNGDTESRGSPDIHSQNKDLMDRDYRKLHDGTCECVECVETTNKVGGEK